MMQHGHPAIAAASQAHLEALAGELRGERRPERLGAILDELIRIEAVVAPDADSAIACLDRLGVDPDLVAPLRSLAREGYIGHRERILRIREGEWSRAGFVARRARERGR